jgi:hypothetical protein
MLVNTLRHSSQADVMCDAANKCSYRQTIGPFWHGGCRGGADPVLYATNYPSKSHPILFAEWLGWDVRQSSNTWVPELYLLFEMVCNYGLVFKMSAKNGIITNFWTCSGNCSQWPVIRDETPEVFSSQLFVTCD